MSDDLIKHLRNSKGWPTLGNAAADRIEALEANLAKAVEMLMLCRDMFAEVAHPSDPLSVMLNETLAELTGDNDD